MGGSQCSDGFHLGFQKSIAAEIAVLDVVQENRDRLVETSCGRCSCRFFTDLLVRMCEAVQNLCGSLPSIQVYKRAQDVQRQRSAVITWGGSRIEQLLQRRAQQWQGLWMMTAFVTQPPGCVVAVR